MLYYCIICWGGSLSGKDKELLNRVVRSASNIIGMTLPTVDELDESCVIKGILQSVRGSQY